MQTLGGVSEYLINGRKFSTRAEVAGAGGSRHRDKKVTDRHKEEKTEQTRSSVEQRTKKGSIQMFSNKNLCLCELSVF